MCEAILGIYIHQLYHTCANITFLFHAYNQRSAHLSFINQTESFRPEVVFTFLLHCAKPASPDIHKAKGNLALLLTSTRSNYRYSPRINDDSCLCLRDERRYGTLPGFEKPRIELTNSSKVKPRMCSFLLQREETTSVWLARQVHLKLSYRCKRLCFQFQCCTVHL